MPRGVNSFTLQVVISNDTRDALRKWAEEEKRSVSNLCEIVLTEALVEHLRAQKRAARRKAS